MTLLNPDYRDILSALSAEKVEYLLVGAYALAAHGLPRATGNLDLWVKPEPENAARVMRALEAFGVPMKNLSAEDFTRRGTVVQIGSAPQRIDLMTTLEGVPFDYASPRRLDIDLDGIRIPVLNREDLATNKRAVGRPQDMADASWLEGQRHR
jgi:hypothetical protein